MKNQLTNKVAFSVMNGVPFNQKPLESKMSGTLIDISQNGLGFLTDVPLKPGNVLKFDNLDACNSGIVMWTIQSDKSYRVGVRFVAD